MFTFVRGLALAATLAALPILALAAYWAGRLAWADFFFRQSTLPAIQRAIAITPDNAFYFDQLAYVNDLEGGPRAVTLNALRRSLALNPRNSEAWITLAIEAEQDGRYEEAEQYLQRATAIDRQFDPSWSLANFYFRRGDFARFAPAAKTAVHMSVNDPRPIFQMAWRLTSDAAKILAEVVPPEPLRLTQYLAFLTAEGKLEAARPVSERVLATGDPQTATGVLAWYLARLVEQHQRDEAVRIWNGLCANRWVQGQPFDPALGLSLSDGDFLYEPAQMVFGWMVHKQPGVTVTRYEAGRGLRVSFSGRQAEHLEVLYQILPVLPGRRYILTLQAITSPLPAASGLRWLVFEGAQGGLLTPDAPHLSQTEWTEQAVEFTVPQNTGLVRLALRYERAPGTTPIEGWAIMRKLRLRFAP